MRRACCLLLLLIGVGPFAAQIGAAERKADDAEARYRSAIEARAEKVVAALGIAEAEKVARVRTLIVQQYFSLRKLHERRDASARPAVQAAGADKAAARAANEKARQEIRPELEKLHGEFLAALAKELSPAQIEQVKDGMTYGVVALTYNVYLKMYPAMTPGEKKQIMAWLVEARELAMDEGTSQEKHALFDKYKGKINNFLSKAGYDSKQGKENLKRSSK